MMGAPLDVNCMHACMHVLELFIVYCLLKKGNLFASILLQPLLVMLLASSFFSF
jgi:hypothetical protein